MSTRALECGYCGMDHPSSEPCGRTQEDLDVPAFIRDINWPRLREQKQWLLTHERVESDGLVALIDALQDYAADQLGVRGVFK